jgi:hypothetical protein
MSTLIFTGPRLKTKRAKNHIDILEQEMAELSSRLYLQQVLIEENETHYIWGWKFSEPLPADISLLVGDAVHNARSALDLLICDVARLRGITETSKLYFPIYGSEERFYQFINDKNSKPIKKLGNDVVTILSKIHKTSDLRYVLRKMHELDIRDKHDLIIPTLVSIPATFNFEDTPFAGFLPSPAYMHIHENRVLHMSKDASASHIQQDHIKGQMTIRHQFDKIEHGFYTDRWSGDMVDALRDFVSATNHVIDIFSSDLLGA